MRNILRFKVCTHKQFCLIFKFLKLSHFSVHPVSRNHFALNLSLPQPSECKTNNFIHNAHTHTHTHTFKQSSTFQSHVQRHTYVVCFLPREGRVGDGLGLFEFNNGNRSQSARYLGQKFNYLCK